MAEEDSDEGGGRFSHLEVDYMRWLAGRIERGEYVAGAELAMSLRAHGSRPIPEAVLDYLCRYLEGQVERPKGRKPLPAMDQRRIDMIIRGLYYHYYGYLKNRERRYGHHAGWTKCTYPPGEMAGRLVARHYYYGECSWRTVQNIASRK